MVFKLVINSFESLIIIEIMLKNLVCEICKKSYESKYMHSVLGVWVCIFCCPNVKKYCDCCNKVVSKKEVDVVNGSLIDWF